MPAHKTLELARGDLLLQPDPRPVDAANASALVDNVPFAVAVIPLLAVHGYGTRRP